MLCGSRQLWYPGRGSTGSGAQSGIWLPCSRFASRGQRCAPSLPSAGDQSGAFTALPPHPPTSLLPPALLTSTDVSPRSFQIKQKKYSLYNVKFAHLKDDSVYLQDEFEFPGIDHPGLHELLPLLEVENYCPSWKFQLEHALPSMKGRFSSLLQFSLIFLSLSQTCTW